MKIPTVIDQTPSKSEAQMANTSSARQPRDAAAAGPQFTLEGTMPVKAVITLTPDEAAFTDEAIDRRIREGQVDWQTAGAPSISRVTWATSGGCA